MDLSLTTRPLGDTAMSEGIMLERKPLPGVGCELVYAKSLCLIKWLCRAGISFYLCCLCRDISEGKTWLDSQ